MNIFSKIFNLFQKNERETGSQTHFKAFEGAIFQNQDKEPLTYTINKIENGVAYYCVAHPTGNITTSKTSLIFFEDLFLIGRNFISKKSKIVATNPST